MKITENSYKTIKKALKVTLTILGICLFLLMGAYFALNNQGIQHRIVGRLTSSASENLDAKIKIGSVDFSLFNKFVLNDVLIEEQKGDTILYGNTLSAKLHMINFFKREITLNEISMDHAQVHFDIDSNKQLNIQPIVDALKRKDTTKPRWKFIFKDVHLTNSTFQYTSYQFNSDSARQGIDFNNLYLDELNIIAEDFHKTREPLTSFLVKKMNFKTPEGFIVKNISTQINIGPELFEFVNVNVTTPLSDIRCEQLLFTHDSWQDWKARRFLEYVDIHMNLNRSSVYLDDLGFFVPGIKGYKKDISLSGEFDGCISDLKGKNVELLFGEQSKILSDFSFKGLPNINEAYIYLDVQKIATSVDEIKEAQLGQIIGKKISFPKELENLGNIQYKGAFTGFINDFVAYGTIYTDIGTISTDILLKPNEDGILQFKGDIAAKPLKLGKLVNQEEIMSDMYIDAHANGYIQKDNKVKAYISGDIKRIGINDYWYKNISIKGVATNKTYDGVLTVNDKNLALEFNGKVDFSDKIPFFDFQMQVDSADLYALNIDQSDTLSNTSFMIQTKFTATDTSHINGMAKLGYADFENSTKTLNLENIICYSVEGDKKQQFIIESPYFKGELTGQYSLIDLPKSLKRFVNHYLPSLQTDAHKQTEKLQLSFEFTNAEKIFNYFFNTLNIANGTMVKAFYHPEKYQLDVNLESDKLIYGNGAMNDFSIAIQANPQKIDLSAESSVIEFNDKHIVKHFISTNHIHDDSIKAEIQWDKLDTNIIGGHFQMLGTFAQSSQNPVLNIELSPSFIHERNYQWDISHSFISIDTSSIHVKDLKISENNQLLKLSGTISENSEDELVLDAENFSLSHINALLKSNKLLLSGELNGHAVLSEYYTNAIFESQLNISNMKINTEILGDLTISSRWSDEDKILYFNALSKHNITNLDFVGRYIPNRRFIDVKAQLNEVPIQLINPYVQNIFSDLKGKITGPLEFIGKIQNPKLNADFELSEFSFLVDYLNTNYRFNDEIQIRDNKILFENVNIYDQLNNKANIQGYVKLEKMKNILVDLTIDTDKLLAMKTSYGDGNSYYGDAFVSGISRIKGNSDDLNIDVSVKTLKNTDISIPISGGGTVEQKDFITFVSKENDTVKKEPIKENTKQSSNLNLNIDLGISQNTISKIIFESESIGVIESRGEGDLKIGLNDEDQFNMYGLYNIIEGEYLFTLQNLINKKFKIQQGGRIEWDGSPLNANIDIKAVYVVKTTLNNLFYTDTTNMYRERIPVECQILLSGRLKNPDIEFAIDVPTLEPELQHQVTSILNSEEKVSKQFLALLIFNNFIPPQEEVYTTYNGNSSNIGARNVGLTTTTELLSTQLSNWLSQISEEVDVGVNYRPGDEISTDEVEVALSTHILNDRVSISGNVDVGGDRVTKEETPKTANIVGDFNVDVKLNKSGKLHLKAYNKVNENLLYEQGPYTQGVGITYKEDFDSFKELLKKYLNNKSKKSEKN